MSTILESPEVKAVTWTVPEDIKALSRGGERPKIYFPQRLPEKLPFQQCLFPGCVEVCSCFRYWHTDTGEKYWMCPRHFVVPGNVPVREILRPEAIAEFARSTFRAMPGQWGCVPSYSERDLSLVWIDTEYHDMREQGKSAVLTLVQFQRFGIDDGPVVIDVRHLPFETTQAILREILTGKIVCGHNITSDLTVIQPYDIDVGGYFDTLIVASVLEGYKHSLAGDEDGGHARSSLADGYSLRAVVDRYCPGMAKYVDKTLRDFFITVCIPGMPAWDDPIPNEVFRYSALDISLVWHVYYALEEYLQYSQERVPTLMVEHAVIPAIVDMQARGFPLDKELYLERVQQIADLAREPFQKIFARMESAYFTSVGYTFPSSEQVQEDKESRNKTHVKRIYNKVAWEEWYKDTPREERRVFSEWQAEKVSAHLDRLPPRRELLTFNMNSTQQKVSAINGLFHLDWKSVAQDEFREFFRLAGVPESVTEENRAYAVEGVCNALCAHEWDDCKDKRVFSLEEAGDFLDFATDYLAYCSYSSKVSKLRNDTRFHRDGCITSSFGTATSGRLTSRKPNLQNIPADKRKFPVDLRDAFNVKEVEERTGKKYSLCCIDLSNAEKRILAAVSRCEVMLGMFSSGVDFHSATAKALFDIDETVFQENVKKYGKLKLHRDGIGDARQTGKTLGFALGYGGSAFRLRQMTGMDIDLCKRLVQMYRDSTPAATAWVDCAGAWSVQTKLSLTRIGRLRDMSFQWKTHYIDALKDAEKDKNTEEKGTRFSATPQRKAARKADGDALRQGMNNPIQGGCADVVKMIMAAVVRSIRENHMDAWLAASIHDEIVVVVEEHQANDLSVRIGEIVEKYFHLVYPEVSYPIEKALVEKYWVKDS